jgi:hypothetical protein
VSIDTFLDAIKLNAVPIAITKTQTSMLCNREN